MPATSQTLLDLVLGRSAHDRAALRRRDPGLIPTLLADPDTRVFDVYRNRVVLDASGTALALRSPQPADDDRLAVYLGSVEGREHVAVVRGAEGAPDDARSLRAVGLTLDDVQISLVTAAVGIANWHATQGFCPRCGRPTEVVEAGWVRRCVADGTDIYPRTDPAVIMAVIDDDDRLLLARNVRRHLTNSMSVLAGFVEPGEALEAAVAREVMEEVGVSVDRVTFMGDQPWPFPASLMVGYTARATTTGLRVDPEEIDVARWFDRAEFSGALRSGELAVPPRLSIAHHLIEHWYGGPIPQNPDHDGARRNG